MVEKVEYLERHIALHVIENVMFGTGFQRQAMDAVRRMRCVSEKELAFRQLDKMLARYGLSAQDLETLGRAKRQGRLRVVPEADIGTCGTCVHFQRHVGTAAGECEHCKAAKIHQSHKKCKHYEKGDE